MHNEHLDTGYWQDECNLTGSVVIYWQNPPNIDDCSPIMLAWRVCPLDKISCESIGRVPDAYKGIQVSFCKNRYCRNKGRSIASYALDPENRLCGEKIWVTIQRIIFKNSKKRLDRVFHQKSKNEVTARTAPV